MNLACPVLVARRCLFCKTARRLTAILMEVLGHVQLSAGEGDVIRIAQVTDVHCFPESLKYWDSPKGRTIHLASPYSKTGHIELLDAVLNRCKPHFVVFTGDIIDGRPFSSSDPSGWRPTFQKLLEPVHKLGPFGAEFMWPT